MISDLALLLLRDCGGYQIVLREMKRNGPRPKRPKASTTEDAKRFLSCCCQSVDGVRQDDFVYSRLAVKASFWSTTFGSEKSKIRAELLRSCDLRSWRPLSLFKCWTLISELLLETSLPVKVLRSSVQPVLSTNGENTSHTSHTSQPKPEKRHPRTKFPQTQGRKSNPKPSSPQLPYRI